MSSGMKKIAGGLLLLSFHITIGKLVIFPPVVGAALLLWGIRDLLGRVPKPGWLFLAWQSAAVIDPFSFWSFQEKAYIVPWISVGAVLLEYGVFWYLFTRLGTEKNWSGDYSRRLFCYSILMTIGITRYIKEAPFWTPNDQLFSVVLMLAARAYLLFAAIMEDEEPSKEKETGMDSI
ncbi:MAG: hypothetical protein ACOX8K_05190 [Lachnospiraceae bacterium]|jgi:hypothetical protein